MSDWNLGEIGGKKSGSDFVDSKTGFISYQAKGIETWKESKTSKRNKTLFLTDIIMKFEKYRVGLLVFSSGLCLGFRCQDDNKGEA